MTDADGAAWRGDWIWLPDESEAVRNVHGLFRREFNCAAATGLEVRITADTRYGLILDGQWVANGPARSHPGAWAYDTLSLALAAGSHCLGVLVWHDGEENACTIGCRPAWCADIRERTGGNTGLDLSSGPAWQGWAGDCWRRDFPERMSHFGFPEELDLRAYPQGWDRPGFDAAGWTPAAIVAPAPDSGPWGRLVPRDIALLERASRLPTGLPLAAGVWQAGPEAAMPSGAAAARTRTRDADAPAALPWCVPAGSPASGYYLSLDFGGTISGYPVIEVADSVPGQCLDILYDECVAPDSGAVDPERTYAKLADRYRLPGGACTVRVTQPRGFRFLTLDLAADTQPARIERVTVTTETYPFRLWPVFQSDRPELDALVGQCARTVQACTADAFMDCPTRERVQWTQDLYIHALVAMDVFGDLAMPRRALVEAARGQLADGRINGFFPTARSNCAFASSSLMWLLLLDEFLLHGGGDATDQAFLLEAAARVLETLAGCCDASGLITRWPAGQFYSWEPIEQSGTLLVTNAFHILILERFALQPELAALTAGRPEQLADLRAAAHRQFFLPDRKRYADAVLADGTLSPVTSQFANALAVLSGICPAGEARSLLERIVAPDQLGPVPVGEHSLKPERDRVPGAPLVPVGTLFAGHWLCRALLEQGAGSVALEQIDLLWGPYRGLPTLPEVRIQAGNTGFCHGWAAGPAFLLPRYVLGLRREGPRRARLAPVASTLAQASGCLPDGPAAQWVRQADGRLRAHVTVPPDWTLHCATGDDDPAGMTLQGPCEREIRIELVNGKGDDGV